MISMLTNALVMASMLSPSPLTWNFEVTVGFLGAERVVNAHENGILRSFAGSWKKVQSTYGHVKKYFSPNIYWGS